MGEVSAQGFAEHRLQATGNSLVSLRGDVGKSPSPSPLDVIDRFSLGPPRPERSVGRHVLDSSSPYSCLVPLSPYLQGWADRSALVD